MKITPNASGSTTAHLDEKYGVKTASGIVYASRSMGDLALDLYQPATDSAVPVVIWLHGGGWFTGDRTLAPDLATYFVSRGIAMASIDYRLSGKAIFPAQLHDVRAAIRFLRANANSLKLKSDAIGLWGSSAGGHLAALTGLTGHIPRLDGEPQNQENDQRDTTVESKIDTEISPRVRVVAESYGPVDLIAGVHEAQAKLPGRDATTSPESMLLGGLPSERKELAHQANPLNWITSQAPPFQISHGTADHLVSHRQSQRLHEALTAAGIESELYLLDGSRHGFLNPAGRLDVEVARVMDDGRLEAEGPAKP